MRNIADKYWLSEIPFWYDSLELLKGQFIKLTFIMWRKELYNGNERKSGQSLNKEIKFSSIFVKWNGHFISNCSSKWKLNYINLFFNVLFLPFPFCKFLRWKFITFQILLQNLKQNFQVYNFECSKDQLKPRIFILCWILKR